MSNLNTMLDLENSRRELCGLSILSLPEDANFIYSLLIWLLDSDTHTDIKDCATYMSDKIRRDKLYRHALEELKEQYSEYIYSKQEDRL